MIQLDHAVVGRKIAQGSIYGSVRNPLPQRLATKRVQPLIEGLTACGKSRMTVEQAKQRKDG